MKIAFNKETFNRKDFSALSILSQYSSKCTVYEPVRFLSFSVYIGFRRSVIFARCHYAVKILN